MKLFLMAFFCLNTYANIHLSPPNFDSYVFVDIKKITSDIQVNFASKEVIATTMIEFENFQSGKPIFDLVPDAIEAEVDGLAVEVPEISSPDNQTKFRAVNKNLPAGNHRLMIKNKITENLNFTWWSGHLNMAFWMTDLNDRGYLENYIPTNLEYDQFELELNVVLGSEKVNEHELFTNGELTETSTGFHIKYPDYFSSSSLYFHLAKKDKFEKKSLNFTSMSGRSIPITIYSSSKSNINRAETETLAVLSELEGIFGAWAHPSLVIYVAGRGGMEYAGATRTSLSALGHELIHSYFARGVMPVRGNSGWIDEAIASWRDKGYQYTPSTGFYTTSMAAHSVYRRNTDYRAYNEGAKFMAYLNYELSELGGLKVLLKDIYSNHVHTSITTVDFKKFLENFSGKDFTRDFEIYILGQRKMQVKHNHKGENPNHPRLSKKEYLDLL